MPALLLALLMLAAPAVARPQGGAPGVVAGVVRDSAGRALRGARVQVPALELGAATGAYGRFAIRLPTGSHEVVTTALGYAPARRRVLVRVADTTWLDLELQPTALSLAGVTVTAGPVGRDAGDVGAAVTTLGTRDLERTRSMTLAATLAREPGITMRSQGPAATMPVIRGMTGDRIVVLQDGMRSADLAASAPDHGVTVDPLAAREVEVVRGPATLLYGSSALGGVVNVVSEDIPRVVPARRVTSLSLAGETAAPGGGTWLDVTQPMGSRTALTVRGGARSHADQRPGGQAWPRLANTSARNRSLVAGLGHVSPSFAGGVAWRHYGFEYGLPARDAAGAIRLRGDREELSARARLAPQGGPGELRVEGTVQGYQHDESLPGGEVATRLALDTRQLQAIARVGEGRVLRGATIGAGLLHRANGLSGSAALMPPNVSMAGSAFAFHELSRGRWRFPVAMRIERATATTRETHAFGPAQRRRHVARSASLGVVAAAGAAGTIGMTASQATRVPSVEELFSHAGHAGTGAFEVGNPDVAPEVTRGGEVTWRLERPRVRAHVAAFHTGVRGWIGLYPSGRDTTVTSGGQPVVLPLLQVSQRPARLSGAEWQVERQFARHAVVGASGDLLRARDAAGRPLPYMPAARLGGAARWDTPRWQVGVAVRHALRQPEVPPGEWRAPGWTQADAWAGLRVLQGEVVHAVMLRLENAGDRTIREATNRAKDYAPGPGRNASLSWQLTF